MKTKRKNRDILLTVLLVLAVLMAVALITFKVIGSRAYGEKEHEEIANKSAEVPLDEEVSGVAKSAKEIAAPTASPYEYPYNTLSYEIKSNELCGFNEYSIPSGYKRSGGELPLIVQQYLYAVCNQYDFEYATALAVMEVESGYRWDAVSQCGAIGYMQIIPKYHEERMERLGVTDIKNPFQNIVVAVDYLAELKDRFEDMDKFLTAYTYGVTGAYRHVWNAGLDNCEYSRKVKKAARRIRRKL